MAVDIARRTTSLLSTDCCSSRENNPTLDTPITRRSFLTGIAAVGGLTALGSGSVLEAARRPRLAGFLPNPSDSGIEHIVVVTMENRSFDHLLGWLPGANGRQAGLSYTDAAGAAHPTYHLQDFQGCGHPDPDHSYAGGRVEYDNGACDGWLRAGSNDVFSIGYYTQGDLPFLGQAAPRWTCFSNYFAAMMAETYPNRIYQHAAQTDRLTNTTSISVLPTIWDLLAAQGVSASYYYSDLPFLALWGAKYLTISQPIAKFYLDALAGTLPAVSFVDPRFLGEEQGLSNDDHPHGDIRNGEAFLGRVYAAITSGAAWASTVMVINFDEWGGFFEHVPPQTAPIPTASAIAGDTDGRRGFRVPCLMVSPWARRGAIDGALYDHCSVLNMIEWRWGLSNLTVRDASAANLAQALDFSHKDLRAPQFAVPQGPFGSLCTSQLPGLPVEEDWAELVPVALSNGWTVY